MARKRRVPLVSLAAPMLCAMTGAVLLMWPSQVTAQSCPATPLCMSAAEWGGYAIKGQTVFGSGYGVWGDSDSAMGIGVLGTSGFTVPTMNNASAGVYGNGNFGVIGQSANWGTAFRAYVGSGSNAIEARLLLDDGTVSLPRFLVLRDGSVYSEGIVVASEFQTSGADFAEAIRITGDPSRYLPGSVLAISPEVDRSVELAGEEYSHRVAGVVSTKPGVLAAEAEYQRQAADHVPMAITGIVPCRATAANGPIERGDLLVAASEPGFAMKGTDAHRLSPTSAAVPRKG